MKKSFLFTLMALLVSIMANAQEGFVVINGEATVYENSNGSSPCLNQFDENVTLQPGMLMKVIEKSAAMTKIQYVAGGEGWINNSSILTSDKTEDATTGTYEVINADGIKVTIDGNLKCKFLGEELTGQRIGGAIVFLNQFGDVVLSVVKMPNEKTYVYTYDNQFTCFI